MKYKHWNKNLGHNQLHEQLDHLTFRFFKVFAQLEYALKAMGYGRAAKKMQQKQTGTDLLMSLVPHYFMSKKKA